MSMNLHCNKIELWQTPTYITYMCLETETPKAALEAYLHWSDSQVIKIARNDEEYQIMKDQRERAMEHRKEVESVLDDASLEVYVV